MEAILKFDLNDPDDRMAHFRAVKSLDMALALNDLAYLWHEAASKIGTEEYDKDPYQWWSEHIQDILEDKGINTEELVI